MSLIYSNAEAHSAGPSSGIFPLELFEFLGVLELLVSGPPRLPREIDTAARGRQGDGEGAILAAPFPQGVAAVPHGGLLVKE